MGCRGRGARAGGVVASGRELPASALLRLCNRKAALSKGAGGLRTKGLAGVLT